MHLVKLPNDEFINLALVQRVQVDEDRPTIVVYWQDSHNIYHNEQAIAVVEALAELATDKSYVKAIAPKTS